MASSSSSSRGNQDQQDKWLLSMPLGFKFIPTDREILIDYLRKRIEDPIHFHFPLISDINLYEYHPQELLLGGKKEAYIYTSRKRKHPNGKKANRVAKGGFWRKETRDMGIYDKEAGGEEIGQKVYFEFISDQGSRSKWRMWEYRIDKLQTPPTTTGKDSSMILNDWVVCKIQEKDEKDQNPYRIQVRNQEGVRDDEDYYGAENQDKYDEDLHRWLFALPSGVKFLPTDRELVMGYLKKKIQYKGGFHFPLISQVKLNDFHPRELLDGKQEMYLFTLNKPKHSKGKSVDRTAKGGFWRKESSEKAIEGEGGVVIGSKSFLIFVSNGGVKSKWRMWEYQMQRGRPATGKEEEEDSMLDDWVLCKVYEIGRTLNAPETPTNDEQAQKEQPNHDIHDLDSEIEDKTKRSVEAKRKYLTLLAEVRSLKRKRDLLRCPPPSPSKASKRAIGMQIKSGDGDEQEEEEGSTDRTESD